MDADITQVRMPAGYTFGISAASADVPDSFESKAFVVSHDHHNEQWKNAAKPPPVNELGKKGAKLDHAHSDSAPKSDFYWIQEGDQIKDAPSSKYKNEDERFQDIHDRLMLANHQMDALFHDLSALKDQQEWWHNELKGLMGAGAGSGDQASRAGDMYSMIEAIKKDVEDKDYRHHIELLANAIQHGHDQVLMGLGHGINGSKSSQ